MTSIKKNMNKKKKRKLKQEIRMKSLLKNPLMKMILSLCQELKVVSNALISTASLNLFESFSNIKISLSWIIVKRWTIDQHIIVLLQKQSTTELSQFYQLFAKGLTTTKVKKMNRLPNHGSQFIKN